VGHPPGSRSHPTVARAAAKKKISRVDCAGGRGESWDEGRGAAHPGQPGGGGGRGDDGAAEVPCGGGGGASGERAALVASTPLPSAPRLQRAPSGV
jgi:hypothetical protein